MGILNKLLSMGENRLINKYWKIVEKINALEPEFKAMSDDEIRAESDKLKERNQGKDSLPLEDKIRALALCREHIWRSYHQRAYDVQLIGALALDDGHIAELKTGEGKTLVSRLTVYLGYLLGVQTHLVTVNEYLADRDANDCRTCLSGLGVTVGYIYNQQQKPSKHKAYACDVVYGTPSEFGFDYLRDNMATRLEDKCQKKRDFAIVDEADSILIDEARTPLIISGAGTQTVETYQAFAQAVRGLVRDIDYDIDEKQRQIAATEVGLAKVEAALGVDDLYADPTGMYPSHLQCALKAEYLFHKNKDYIVTDGEVKIVDEFTGRIMEGRRWSEGIHQAIEAKEGVAVQEENQTLATVTLQNFFRLYTKLSGMTGTAATEDAELRKTYDTGVVVIPPNKPVIRIDAEDLVYQSIDGKYKAIADEIEERHSKGQPILVGTVSVEMNEKLSRLLSKRGIPHEILNAKHHAREAAIVAQAGRKGAVTIATNMAGRGTDIILGGNPDGLYKVWEAEKIASREPDPETGEVDTSIPDAEKEEAMRLIEAECAKEQEEVLAAGGLCVLGTERHESRRIDNQLRGRAGRQGDPGYSQFYISLDDDLMQYFGQEKMARIKALMATAEVPEDTPIQTKMVSKSIENAQHTVEGVRAETRKHVLEYDDVMNLQRKAIYAERDYILENDDISEKVEGIIGSAAEKGVLTFCNPGLPIDDWDFEGLRIWYKDLFGHSDEEAAWLDESNKELEDNVDGLIEAIEDEIREVYEDKAEMLGEDSMKDLQRQLMLRMLDKKWMDHLANMDYIKNGIGLRGYGQRDPLVEYKEEAFAAFSGLVEDIYKSFLQALLRLQVEAPAPIEMEDPDEMLAKAQYSRVHSPAHEVTDDLRRQAVPFSNAPIGAAPFEKANGNGIAIPPIEDLSPESFADLVDENGQVSPEIASLLGGFDLTALLPQIRGELVRIMGEEAVAEEFPDDAAIIESMQFAQIPVNVPPSGDVVAQGVIGEEPGSGLGDAELVVTQAVEAPVNSDQGDGK